MTDDLIERAMKSYRRRFGCGAPIPANTSDIEQIGGEQFVVLRNINGELARFKIDPRGRLWFVEDRPAHA